MMTTETSRELALYIINDSNLYRQQTQPIIANLKRRIARGIYESEKALKLWLHLTVSGAKGYTKIFGAPNQAWFYMFSVSDRKLAAQEIAAHYADELELENA